MCQAVPQKTLVTLWNDGICMCCARQGFVVWIRNCWTDPEPGPESCPCCQMGEVRRWVWSLNSSSNLPRYSKAWGGCGVYAGRFPSCRHCVRSPKGFLQKRWSLVTTGVDVLEEQLPGLARLQYGPVKPSVSAQLGFLWSQRCSAEGICSLQVSSSS